MTTAEKIDLYKLHKLEYAAKRTPALVEVGNAAYLAVSGHGAPGGTDFSTAIGALYGVAFTVKMTRKFAGKEDYGVCKLECLWEGGFENPDQCKWQLMIRTPEFVTAEDVDRAAAVLIKRGKGEEAKRVHIVKLKEGLCVQALHVGPYIEEPVSAAAMKSFAESKGLEFHGRFREIYLSDPRRIAPERLKTILRQPVRAKAGAPRR